MSEVIHVKGSGGGVWEMTLPLQPAIQRQLDDGQVTRVNPDGSDWSESEPKPATARKPAAKPKQQ